MILWEFPDVDIALQYFQACWELGADTEDKRIEILQVFAEHGQLASVRQTNRTKEQLLTDLRKHSTVLDLTSRSAKMSNDTVCLTEREVAILAVFIKYQLFDSHNIMSELKTLIRKLEIARDDGNGIS